MGIRRAKRLPKPGLRLNYSYPTDRKGNNVFRRSLDLAKASWGVIKVNRELLALPVISMLVILGAVAVFGGSLLALGEESRVPFGILGGLFLAYFFAVTVIFFQTAMVCAARQHFAGGDPTIGSAIRAAWTHIGPIMGWALIAVIVQVILGKLRDSGFLGHIAASILGALFAFATFLVIPIIASEGVGPIEAMKRSTGMLKKTWGENIIGRFGLGILGFLLALPGVLVVVAGIALLSGAFYLAGWLMIVLGVLMVIASGVLMSALNSIYQAAVYQYAVDGQVNNFSSDQLVSAFQTGTRSRRWGSSSVFGG